MQKENDLGTLYATLITDLESATLKDLPTGYFSPFQAYQDMGALLADLDSKTMLDGTPTPTTD